jgi:hypothetical protein
VNFFSSSLLLLLWGSVRHCKYSTLKDLSWEHRPNAKAKPGHTTGCTRPNAAKKAS